MRYRLSRQGMLELDAWLSPLLDADMRSDGVMAAIDGLLACEATELQAMMYGDKPAPEALRELLSRR